MIEKVFDWFIDAPAKVPSRSRLNPVRPIGVGTPFVQSLPSYIHSVATSHNIPTWALASKILAPHFRRETVTTKSGHCDLFGGMGASTLGNNHTAAETVTILEALTCVPDLVHLTLLNLGKAVRGAVIRGKQAWCSECLSEFAKHATGIYQPLLWSIRDINVCPTHRSKLQTECPTCGKGHRPLTRYQWDGCCPRCDAPLTGKVSTPDESEGWDLRLAKRAGEALMSLQELKSPIKTSCFPGNIRRLCASFSDGNVSELARQLQIHHSNIQDWMIEKQVPSLSSLLRISAVFEVPVLDWLVKSVDTTPCRLFNVRSAAPKRPLRRCDLSMVRTKLDTLINAEHEFPPSSFAEICRRLGAEQSFAARKFPDHARILIERRKNYLSIKKQMGQQFTKLAVETTFTRLLSDGVRPTSTQMAKSLPKGIALRDRGARDEFNRLRRELAAEFQEIQSTIAAPVGSETAVGNNKVAAAVLDP